MLLFNLLVSQKHYILVSWFDLHSIQKTPYLWYLLNFENLFLSINLSFLKSKKLCSFFLKKEVQIMLIFWSLIVLLTKTLAQNLMDYFQITQIIDCISAIILSIIILKTEKSMLIIKLIYVHLLAQILCKTAYFASTVFGVSSPPKRSHFVKLWGGLYKSNFYFINIYIKKWN